MKIINLFLLVISLLVFSGSAFAASYTITTTADEETTLQWIADGMSGKIPTSTKQAILDGLVADYVAREKAEYVASEKKDSVTAFEAIDKTTFEDAINNSALTAQQKTDMIDAFNAARTGM